MGGGSWSCRGSSVFLCGAISVCFAMFQLHLAGCGGGVVSETHVQDHCGPTATYDGCLVSETADSGQSIGGNFKQDTDCCSLEGHGYCMEGFMYLKQHATQYCRGSSYKTSCCVPMSECEYTCQQLAPRRRRQVVSSVAANPNESPEYADSQRRRGAAKE